jgi:hypothetical protein
VTVEDFGGPVLWLLVFAVVAFLFMRKRRRPPGSAAAGTVYDWLNEDKRHAVELIVEERAAARDPEHRDGNLPDLEEPTRKSGPEE